MSLSIADARIARLLALDDALRTEHRPYLELLQRIAEAALEIVGCDGTGIALRGGDELIIRAAAGKTGMLGGKPIDLRGSLAGRAFTTGNVVVAEDGFADPRASVQHFRTSGTGSGIFVPLFGPSSTVGVLGAAWGGARTFTDGEIHTARLVGKIIAAQVARAEAASTRAALLDREQLLSAIFDESPLMMAVVQLEGADQRYLSINQAGAARFGKRVDEIAGRLASELGIAPEALDWWCQRFEQAHAKGGSLRVDYTSAVSPSVYSTVICALPTLPGQPRRAVFISEDTSERRQLREQLATADRRAAVGHLAAGVAHELNNPMAFVRSNLAFVTEELTAHRQALPEAVVREVSDALTEARDGVDRMQRIVSSLLTYARSAPTQLQSTRLEEVARSTAQMARGTVQATADLIEELGQTPPVAADGVRLGQVVLNLLLNAAQAVRADGARHTVKLITRLGPGGEAVLEVSDTGEGITPHTQPRLFEPFFTTKPPGQGTGLGLSICKNIVESAGGRITVDSTVGQGTTFRVTLPPAVAESGSKLG